MTMGVDAVLALNETARIVPGGDVAKPNVVWKGTEERNAVSNQHGHVRDDETLDQPRAQEPLNRHPAVDIEVVRAGGGEPRDDVSRRAAHLLDDAAADRGQVDGLTAQDDDAGLAVRPGLEPQHRL